MQPSVPCSYFHPIPALIRADKRVSNLDGKMIAVKDNICTVGEPTTCASTILNGFRSPFAATVVSKLRDKECLLTGKTNLDEFGMGYVGQTGHSNGRLTLCSRSHSTNSAFGPTRNSVTIDGQFLSAGGSSGGSAVAVATNQSHAYACESTLRQSCSLTNAGHSGPTRGDRYAYRQLTLEL